MSGTCRQCQVAEDFTGRAIAAPADCDLVWYEIVFREVRFRRARVIMFGDHLRHLVDAIGRPVGTCRACGNVGWREHLLVPMVAGEDGVLGRVEADPVEREWIRILGLFFGEDDEPDIRERDEAGSAAMEWLAGKAGVGQ